MNPEPESRKLIVPSTRGTLIWKVARLWEEAQHLPVVELPLQDVIDMLDENAWTRLKPHVNLWDFFYHTRRVVDADLDSPIILSSQGFVVDGVHRVIKAWIEGRPTIRAVRFESDPLPDEVLPLHTPIPLQETTPSLKSKS